MVFPTLVANPSNQKPFKVTYLSLHFASRPLMWASWGSQIGGEAISGEERRLTLDRDPELF